MNIKKEPLLTYLITLAYLIGMLQWHFTLASTDIFNFQKELL